MVPTILYICTDHDLFAGSSKSLLNMIQSLGQTINPIVLFPYDGIVQKIYQNNGIRTLVHRFTDIRERTQSSRIKTLRHPRRHIFYQWYKNDSECVSYIKKTLGPETISLVHSNTTVATIGAFIAHELRIPHVWHIREFLDKDFNIHPFMGRYILRHIINSADARICISKSIQRHWKFKTESTVVIDNAIVDDEKPKIIYNKKKFILFCAALITENKGAESAINGFINSGLPPLGYSLLMVGRCNKDYQHYLVNLASSNGIASKQIEFLGYQDCLSELFRESSAFLMCSKNEGLGRVTVEAMYFGCPVIANATGGTTEIINDKITGRLYTNEAELATLLREVASSCPQKIIEEAQEYAISHFSKSAFRPRIVSLYTSLIPKYLSN